MTIKKAITIGLLGATIIGLIAIGIKFNIFNNKNTKTYETKAEEQITDLTNTTWYLNDTLSKFSPNGLDMSNPTFLNLEIKEISYICDNTTYKSMTWNTNKTSNIQVSRLNYTTTNDVISLVYNYLTNTYQQQTYKTITITGGNDKQDTNLINWLKQNATQITITNLANTTWQIKENSPDLSTPFTKNINFYYNGKSCNQFEIADNQTIRYKPTNEQVKDVVYGSNHWLTDKYKAVSTLIITGGTNAQDTTLIIWFVLNATQLTVKNNLTNTKWTFIDNVYTWQANNQTFDIVFTSNSKTCNGLKQGYISSNSIMAYSYTDSQEIPYAYYQVYQYTASWTSNRFKTITITNGSDVTSTALISFLISNATGTAYQPIPTNPDDYDIENGNFASLQSVMLQILTMPFTFISQAFNVTLWPNTAWEFNISNFIMAIIAIASILFIIKLFTSGFSIIGNYSNNIQSNKLTKQKTAESKARTNLINRTDPNKKTIKKE